MPKDVYEVLAKHLDNLPAGFPRTENCAEMRILRRFFTPELVSMQLKSKLDRLLARK